MNLKYFFLVLIQFEVNGQNYPCLQYGFKHNHYQDIIINNKVICHGYGQSCESRYQAIKKIAKLYSRPITILEIGPAEGYMCFRLAKEFDSTCVMIQNPDDNENILSKLCHLNSLQNLILLHKKITVKQIKRLSDCEHFDIVIVMNVLHHFGESWKNAIQEILNLGENIIIETPPITQDQSTLGTEFLPLIDAYLSNLDGTIIAKTPRWSNPKLLANTYWFKRKKNKLNRLTWFSKKNSFDPNYEIISNYEKKQLLKKIENQVVLSTWEKGINLVTFKMLNGTYPTAETLMISINEKKDNLNTNDCLPHNMVIQGNHIVLIDTNDQRMQQHGWPCGHTYEKILTLLQIQTPKEIRNYYFSVLAGIPSVPINN